MIRADHVHGGNPPDGVLDFSASINPLGPPRAALDAYFATAADICKYPPAYPRDLEAALAGWLKVEPRSVLAGNGSTQLIHLIARVLRPRSPLIVTPTFSEIANSLIIEGIKPRALNTTPNCDFKINSEAVIRCLHDGAGAIFVGRPNSPTGTILTMEQAAEIADECERHDSWCVFDEAFVDFVQDARSTAAFAEKNRKVIILRSLTKIFAIPGLRVGCLVGHPDAVEGLRAAIEPWSVNVVADRVTRACLAIADGFIRETNDFVAGERSRVHDALSQLPGLHVFPSVANFLMIKVEGEQVTGEFGTQMLEQGIMVRDLRSLPGCGPGLYRIGISSERSNSRLLEAALSRSPKG